MAGDTRVKFSAMVSTRRASPAAHAQAGSSESLWQRTALSEGAAVTARHQLVKARARIEIGHVFGPLEAGELTIAF